MIVLRPARKREASTIVRLSDETFGVGYLTLDQINDRYLVARVAGKFTGFISTEIWNGDECGDDFCLSSIETLAVYPDYRGLGLGTMLVAAATAQLIREGADVIECYATTWSDSGICFIEMPLRRNGYEVKQQMGQCWKNDPPTYICPACTKSPCLCTATLWHKQVTQLGEDTLIIRT